MSLSDAELFEAWRSERDAEAFKALAQRYGGLVYSVALRILGNAHEAEDVAQESFASLATTSKPPRGALAPWLHRVATNRSLDRLRTARNRQRREQAYADAQDSESLGANSRPPVWNDIFAYIDEAMNALPDEYRVPMVRHFYENCSGAAIAEELGITRQAASHRIRKGVERVRRALRKRGISVASAALASLLGANLAEASTVPASLSVAFGKLAIAGVLEPTAGSTASTAATLGGLVVMKKAFVGGVVLVIVVAGLWMASREPLPEATPPPPSYVPKARVPEPTEDSADFGKATDTVAAAVEEGLPAEPEVAAIDIATGDITGRIYDVVTGEGIEGVFPVFGWARHTGRVPWEGTSTPSDANGVYCLRGMDPGSYGFHPPDDLPDYPSTITNPQRVTVVADTMVRDVDFPMERGVDVDGLVLSSDGDSVRGATVTASVVAFGNRKMEATSGANGRFAFCLPAGRGFMDIQARKGDALSPKLRHVALCYGGVAGIVLTLSESASASMSGVVVNTRNHPVPGATVEIRDEFVPAGQKGVASSTTDAGGSFQFESLVAGSYQIFLARPEAATSGNASMVVSLAEGEARNDLRLTLEDDLFISGHVVDAKGKGLPNALVQAELRDKDHILYESGMTQEDGRFTLSLVERGHYALGADEGESQRLSTRDGPVVASGTSNAKLVLHPSGHIKGRVCDAAGNPVTRFSLSRVYGWCDTGGLERALRYSGAAQGVFDPEGQFELVARSRKSRLIVMASGFAPLLKDVDVPPGTTVSGVEFRLKPSRRVEGWVVDADGHAVPSAKIIFGALKDEMSLDRAVGSTDSSGFFVLDTVPDEVTTLSALHPSYGPGVAPIRAKMKIVLRAGGCVKGRITLDGQPSSDANVTLRYPEDAGGASYWQRATANGTYEFPNVPAGSCQLRAGDSRGNGAERELQVVSGETLIEDIHFDAGGSVLQGRLIALGLDPERVELTLYLTGEEGQRTYRSRGNAGGTYQIAGIEAGAGPLMAFVDGEERCLVNVQIPEDSIVEQDLELDVVGSITGTLHGVTPEEMGNVIVLKGAVDMSGLVTVEDVQAFIPEATSIAVFRAPADDGGYYEVKGLPYGTYTLVAQTVLRANEMDIAQWRWSAMHVVLAEENREMNLDFDLR